MGKKPVKINTVYQCNCFLGEKTLHPLVSLIDLSLAKGGLHDQLKFGFYTILLQEYNCESFIYGRQYCDYSDGTLLFLPPGKQLSIREDPEILCSPGRLLAFHPDVIRNTALGQHIKNYTFFSYCQDEALHLSLREKQTLQNCLEAIDEELHRAIDKHSQTIVCRNIELLLDHCTRFYDRQFITRSKVNKDLLEKTDQILNEYFLIGQSQTHGLPTTVQCAALLHLSPGYLEDLLKHETGKYMYEYVQFKRLEVAKKQIRESGKTISQIADELGFPSICCFSQLFKKLTGCPPNEYKLLS